MNYFDNSICQLVLLSQSLSSLEKKSLVLRSIQKLQKVKLEEQMANELANHAEEIIENIILSGLKEFTPLCILEHTLKEMMKKLNFDFFCETEGKHIFSKPGKDSKGRDTNFMFEAEYFPGSSGKIIIVRMERLAQGDCKGDCAQCILKIFPKLDQSRGDVLLMRDLLTQLFTKCNKIWNNLSPTKSPTSSTSSEQTEQSEIENHENALEFLDAVAEPAPQVSNQDI